MSAANMSAALRVRGLTLVTRAIFAYLCDRERNNVCWPSIDEMAWELDISRRAVIAAIKKLESLEYIAVSRKPRQSSVYRILCIPVANRYREVRAAMRGACDAPTYGAPDAPIDSAQDAPLPEEQVHEVHADSAQDALHQVHDVHPESPKEESPKDSPKLVKSARAREATDVSVPPDCRVLFDAWNEMARATGLPAAFKLTPDRRKHLNARLKTFSVEEIGSAIAKVGTLRWCREGTATHPNWRADFDWLVTEKAIRKLLEGRYDDHQERPEYDPSKLTGAQRALYLLDRETEQRARRQNETLVLENVA